MGLSVCLGPEVDVSIQYWGTCGSATLVALQLSIQPQPKDPFDPAVAQHLVVWRCVQAGTVDRRWLVALLPFFV